MPPFDTDWLIIGCNNSRLFFLDAGPIQRTNIVLKAINVFRKLCSKLQMYFCVYVYMWSKAEVKQTESCVNCDRRLSDTSASILARPEVVQPALLFPVLGGHTLMSELLPSLWNKNNIQGHSYINIAVYNNDKQQRQQTTISNHNGE